MKSDRQLVPDVVLKRHRRTASAGQILRRSRFGVFVGIALVIVFCLGAGWRFREPLFESVGSSCNSSADTNLADTQVSAPTVRNVLRETAPAVHFRDALRPDTKYITSWPSAGWTNDVMTYFNLIYLGLLTERAPIIPPFTPTHVLEKGSASEVDFGQVFDLPRMQRDMGIPIVEWSQVKNISADKQIDELGCWNVWEVSQDSEKHPRDSWIPQAYSLDISYTTAPKWVRFSGWNGGHWAHRHTSFWSLARLGFSDTRNQNLITPLPSPKHGVSLPPDEQLLCFDYLYYVGSQGGDEYDWDFAPAWRFVGKYAHFTPAIVDLANAYVKKAIGIPEDAPTPPYISIHVRHHDFKALCGSYTLQECYAPVSAYAKRVEEQKAKVLERTGVTVEHVVVTSDETDPDWWAEVFAHEGWVTPDHSQTMARYGAWYPVFIDAAIQAGGAAFLGTWSSTMSRLAARRVEDWQHGPTHMVRWGHPGADDEEYTL
ncbi:hypothetical protein CYLTODRAFT_421950 [Cylindrobasidium torrendii FP15055 ss-10]|uniref:Uncharacterized protein n=1 Tax=Cylindrobasidium torrendii FP15055 ss-10 TaxID=1314674 RepID=A0A0D7BER6_9AGAR|nr:hypothetical protein CYLTODRAFT_421950 [Cylindrobasidium torrendii FP15055 ss-10]